VPPTLALECPSEPTCPHEDRLEAAVSATMQALLGAPGAVRNAVLLESALILRLAGVAADLAAAVGLAVEAIESGAAQRCLDRARQRA
jgi:anthranilate phosphoribosyltransferase